MFQNPFTNRALAFRKMSCLDYIIGERIKQGPFTAYAENKAAKELFSECAYRRCAVRSKNTIIFQKALAIEQ